MAHTRTEREPDRARLFLVRPDGNTNDWLVSEDGDTAAPQRFDSRESAVEAGKTLAQGHGPSLLRVLEQDGSVDDETSYGKDPLVTQLEKFGF
jgi:hypothetical protein